MLAVDRFMERNREMDNEIYADREENERISKCSNDYYCMNYNSIIHNMHFWTCEIKILLSLITETD